MFAIRRRFLRREPQRHSVRLIETILEHVFKIIKNDRRSSSLFKYAICRISNEKQKNDD